MLELFAWEYTGEPFRIFYPPHLATLFIIVLINLSFIILRKYPNPPIQRTIRWGLVAVLLINETAWHTWNWYIGLWTIQTMLPLHMCSMMVFASAIMLMTRSKTIFEFAFFLGIGGATQALLTPPLTIYGFPHIRFFLAFISHGAIVTASVYMAVVEHYRPYLRSTVRVFVGLNIYMLCVTVVNTLIGSNYLFLSHKPEYPTLIDKLGPWPWYIIPMEGIALMLLVVLYAPFAIYDWNKLKRLKHLNA